METWFDLATAGLHGWMVDGSGFVSLHGPCLDSGALQGLSGSWGLVSAADRALITASAVAIKSWTFGQNREAEGLQGFGELVPLKCFLRPGLIAAKCLGRFLICLMVLGVAFAWRWFGQSLFA
jgi:hypothetical protein